MIEPADTDSYTFAMQRGDRDGDIRTVDIVLNAGAFDLAPRAIPIGYVLMLIGVVGLTMTFRRKSGSNGSGETKKSSGRRWGRGEE